MSYIKGLLLIFLIIFLFLFLLSKINIQLTNDGYDIIIVGSGLAGLVSAYESYKLSEGKLKILMLEMQSTYGGNSKKATSGINLINTHTQEEYKIKDSYNLFIEDTIRSYKNESISDLSKELIKTLVYDSEYLYNYFEDTGVQFTMLSQLGGHSKERSHKTYGKPIGASLTSALFNKINYDSNVKIQYDSMVIDLLYDKKNNKVTGIKYIEVPKEMTNLKGKKISIKSKTVILATGGYAYDFNSMESQDKFKCDSLINEFRPEYISFPTTNGYGSVGSGIKIARKIGAQLLDMPYIQIHPTAFVDQVNKFAKHKILAPELFRGLGGLLINQSGNRFCDELGTRDYVVNQIIKHCEKKVAKFDKNIEQYEAYLVINQMIFNSYGDDIMFYYTKGLLVQYQNFDEFAEKNNIDKNILYETIMEYNEAADGKIATDSFNKTVFHQRYEINDTIFVGTVTPAIHYTMGGLKFNTNAEIINENDKPIGGLFGAGEVTGGLHGMNRLGGNSLLECAVFGRRAANSAYMYVLSDKNKNKKK